MPSLLGRVVVVALKRVLTDLDVEHAFSPSFARCTPQCRELYVYLSAAVRRLTPL